MILGIEGNEITVTHYKRLVHVSASDCCVLSKNKNYPEGWKKALI